MSKKLAVALGLLMVLVSSQSFARTLPRQFPVESPMDPRGGVNRRVMPESNRRMDIARIIRQLPFRPVDRRIMPEAVRKTAN